MGDVVDHFDVVYLAGAIVPLRPVAPDHVAAVRCGERQVFIVHFPPRLERREHLQRRVEDVEHQPGARSEMTANAAQTPQLIIDTQEVLKRPEWDGHQGKGPIQRERTHVALHETNPPENRFTFCLQPPFAHGEHPRREIEPRDVDAGTRGRDEDPSGPAAELQYEPHPTQQPRLPRTQRPDGPRKR
jgi:hypothetical protein